MSVGLCKNCSSIPCLSDRDCIMLKNFKIDEQYLCDESVKVYKEHLENRANPTAEDMIKILKGTDRSMISMSTQDHPVFAELRDRLETMGYIEVVRNSWNGDRVIRGFKLNGWTFSKSQKFPCAAALGNSIRCAKKFGWKRLV